MIFSETKRIFVNFQDIEERARKEALELMIVKEVFMNDFEFIIYAFFVVSLKLARDIILAMNQTFI